MKTHTVNGAIAGLASGLEHFSVKVGDLVDDLTTIESFAHFLAHPIGDTAGWAAGKASQFKEWLAPTPAGVTASAGAYPRLSRSASTNTFGFPRDCSAISGCAESWRRDVSAGLVEGRHGRRSSDGRYAQQLDLIRSIRRQSANAAGKYLAQLADHYRGDVSEAIAAYNWAPGNLDKVLASIRKIGKRSRYPPRRRTICATSRYRCGARACGSRSSNNTGGSAHHCQSAAHGDT